MTDNQKLFKMLTCDLNLASKGVEKWEIEHKKYLCHVIKNIIEEVWEKYATKDARHLSKKQLRSFLNDFSGLELTNEEFGRIYKAIDEDRRGRVDELKLGMFIIRVSSLGGILEKDDMRAALREAEYPRGEFTLYPGQFSFL